LHANVLNKLHEAAIVLHCYFSMYIYVCIYVCTYFSHEALYKNKLDENTCPQGTEGPKECLIPLKDLLATSRTSYSWKISLKVTDNRMRRVPLNARCV